MIDALLTALRAEFTGTDVTFFADPPKTPVAPSVVVYPDDPFLQPREAASPIIRENWRVRVVASTKDVSSGITQMRRNSFKIRKAVHSVGGVWDGAGGPVGVRAEGSDNTEFVFVENDIHFRYSADDITDPTP